MLDKIPTADHWVQGTSYTPPSQDRPHYSYCLHGALWTTTHNGRPYVVHPTTHNGLHPTRPLITSRAVETVHNALTAAVHELGHTGGYVKWNDNPTTTYEDVRLLLKTVLATYELATYDRNEEGDEEGDTNGTRP